LERAPQCAELVHLERWREEVAAQTPGGAPVATPNPLDELRQKLDEAVASERFEEAAQLRDEIRRLSDLPLPPGGEIL
jgi:protein-arginine kinase activator protein McsA